MRAAVALLMTIVFIPLGLIVTIVFIVIISCSLVVYVFLNLQLRYSFFLIYANFRDKKITFFDFL